MKVPYMRLWKWGVGPANASDFARVLRNNFDSETTRAAAFALAKLGAKEYKQDIAELLGQEFGNLGEDRFHPFAGDEIKKIKNRFKESFSRMKAKRERQKAIG